MRTALNLLPPVAMIALSIWFLWFNPYNSMPPNRLTVIYVIGLLILPAILIIIAYVLKIKLLKMIGFFWSLPLTLYLGLAGIPSYWTLMIVMWVLYLFIDTGTTRFPQLTLSAKRTQ